MHIGFRTSGGRGEYEVVGGHTGVAAAELEGWQFYMQWPDGIVRDTGLWLDPGDSGKPRLRSVLDSPIQIGRVVSAMLLLPDPTRSLKQTPPGWPIIKAKGYAVTQVGFAPDSELSAAAEIITFVPSWIEVANSGDSDAIGVTIRWNRVVAVYALSDRLPKPVGEALKVYMSLMVAGNTVDQTLVSAVSDVTKQLAGVSNSGYVPGEDPLPVLERMAGIQSDSSEPILPPPNELSEDEPAISARSAEEWRLAKSRGPGGKRFSQLVRAAYRHRCLFCGGEFGGIEGIRSGIDAAHILAWSKHDLDKTSNGIALCKLHHWAFDAGVVTLQCEDGAYYMRHTLLASRLDADSLKMLGADRSVIPPGRLPTDQNDRPDPRHLELLYADLGVSFPEVT